MNFYCEDIVNTDASGSVTGLGIEWTEGRPSTEWLALWLAYCGVIGAVLCLIMAGVRNDAGMVVLAGLSVMFTVAMVMWMRNYDGKHRALVFGRDGSITADEGLCGYTNIRGSLRYTLGDIRSIEAVRMKDKKPDEADSLLHGVKVIMRRGNVLYFAWNLDEDDYFRRQYENLGWRRREIMMRGSVLRWLVSFRVRAAAERMLRPLERRVNATVTKRHSRRHGVQLRP